MKKIIVIGSSNIDMVVKTSHLPVPGETILGGEFFMNQGGTIFLINKCMYVSP